ncbi:MAG: hypothetical protein CVU88_01035 [Firmicutes bacterium HGW-Firmicutes-13]|nr:MAG: hypothetical protein CVU88_01035 [Firmicutes bacterium HGW-Firmicutes-13]
MKKNKNGKKKEKVISFEKDINHYLEKGIACFKLHDYTKGIQYFKKIIETKPENKSVYYTVAFYLSEINKEQEFRILDDIFEESNPHYLFLRGIYFCMEEDVNGAEYHLKKFIIKEPKSKLRQEAEKLIDNIHEITLFQNNLDYIKLTFYYAGNIESVKEKLKIKFESPFVQSKMCESLYEMDDYLISNVIFLYGLLENNKIAEKTLRQFIKSLIVKEKHIELALLSLKKIGAKEPYEIFLNGKFVQVTLKSYMNRYEEMEELYSCWNDVLSIVVHNMKKSNKYSEQSIEKVKYLWGKFINSIYPDLPHLDQKMKRIWAAGLELTLLAAKSINVSSKRLALIYNVPNHEVLSKYNYIKKTIRF